MAGITLDVAETQLELWIAASAAVASGQEYEIDTGGGGRRRLRRVDADSIAKQITFWQGQIAALALIASGARRLRTIYIVPQ